MIFSHDKMNFWKFVLECKKYFPCFFSIDENDVGIFINYFGIDENDVGMFLGRKKETKFKSMDNKLKKVSFDSSTSFQFSFHTYRYF